MALFTFVKGMSVCLRLRYLALLQTSAILPHACLLRAASGGSLLRRFRSDDLPSNMSACTDLCRITSLKSERLNYWAAAAVTCLVCLSVFLSNTAAGTAPNAACYRRYWLQQCVILHCLEPVHSNLHDLNHLIYFPLLYFFDFGFYFLIFVYFRVIPYLGRVGGGVVNRDFCLSV